MIVSIADKTTQDIFDGLESKASRKLPLELHRRAKKLLDSLNAASKLVDLQIPPGNRLEALKGKLKGFHSVRINDQWRIIFRWESGRVYDVEIFDYH